MTIQMTGEGAAGVGGGALDEDIGGRSLIVETTKLFEGMVVDLVGLMERLQSGDLSASKDLAKQLRDVRSAIQTALEERAKLAKLSRTEAGAVYDHALDLDAARHEICRRLACLRDAGNG